MFIILMTYSKFLKTGSFKANIQHICAKEIVYYPHFPSTLSHTHWEAMKKCLFQVECL